MHKYCGLESGRVFLLVYTHTSNCLMSFPWENDIHNFNAIVMMGAITINRFYLCHKHSWSHGIQLAFYWQDKWLTGIVLSMINRHRGQSRLRPDLVHRLITADSWINGSLFDATAIWYLDEASGQIWYSAIMSSSSSSSVSMFQVTSAVNHPLAFLV